MAKKTGVFGIPGSAVLLGMGGLYLIYVGLKDVPLVDGIKSLLRKERPIPRPKPVRESSADSPDIMGFAGTRGSGSDAGIDRLVGYAAMYYPQFKQRFGLTIYGYGLRPNPSDHTLGKALDLMHPNAQQAQGIISMFQPLPGAKYWIWNRQIAHQKDAWRPKPYSGVSPHTDHVHLSFF